DGRVDPARELAQLGEGERQLLVGAREQLQRLVVARGRALAGKAERERQRDEALLRAVVEIALEPPPLCVLRLDEPDARGTELPFGALPLGDVAHVAGEYRRSRQVDPRDRELDRELAPVGA